VNLHNASLWHEIVEQNKTKPEQRIAENIWLIPLHTGLPFLGELAAAAKVHHIPCKLLLFEDVPEWISLDGKIRQLSA
jgi:hypothetical protein